MARTARGGARKSRKSNVITVNFKGVEGKGVALPEGDYAAKPIEITVEDGSKDQYLKWVFEVSRGKHAGKKLYLNTSLAPQALWNLRGLLECLDVEVPDDELDIDTAQIIEDGAEVALTVEHETYEGRKQARVQDFQPVDSVTFEDDEDDAEEDEPKSKKSKAKSKTKDEDDEDEDEDDAPRGRKSKKSASKSSRRSRDDDEDEAEDDDEDDEPKSRKSKKSKGKAKKLTVDDLEDMSEAELEDLVEEHGLDLDLAKAKTLSRKRTKVIDALEEAGLYEAA